MECAGVDGYLLNAGLTKLPNEPGIIFRETGEEECDCIEAIYEENNAFPFFNFVV